MARRVYLAPGVLRVSHPGWDAATAPREGLMFSSDTAALGGSSTGELVFEDSPLGGPSNTPQPVTRVVPLPAGSGIPVVWIWDVRPDLVNTGFATGRIQIYFDAAAANLILSNRGLASHIGYMIYRNRSS